MVLESKCPLSSSSLPAKELCHAIQWLFHTLSQLHPLTLPAFISPLTRALNSLWNWKIEEKQIIFTPSNLPAHLARVCSAQLPITNSGLFALRFTSSLNLRTVLLELPLFSLASSVSLPLVTLTISRWAVTFTGKGMLLWPLYLLPCFFASLKGLFPKRPGSTCCLHFRWSGGLASLLRLGFLYPPHPQTHSRYWQAPLARSSREFPALFLTFQQCWTQWLHQSSRSSFFIWLLRCDFCIFLLPLLFWGFPGGSEGKASACNAGDLGSIPRSGRSLEKEMATHSGTFAWRIQWMEEPSVSSIHGVSKSQTWLSNFTHFLSFPWPLC